jgi:hypothetical protein
MPDLNFDIKAAEPLRFAAEPVMVFKLGVAEKAAKEAEATPIHSIVLRCQVRIEPARRRYQDHEKARLLDLFGTPERWGQTLRPMLWTHVCAIVPPFEATTVVDLQVPCSSDFNLAATKYFAALDEGEIPLCFLFSGTVFHQAPDGMLQVSQISWEKEADYRLAAATWRKLMNQHYPNSAWLSLRKDVFERLARYKSLQGLPSWEHALDRLLSRAEESVSS